MSETLLSTSTLDPVEIQAITPALEELPGAVVVLDPAGRVLFINRIAEQRVDRVRGDIVGQDFFREVLPELERSGKGAEFRREMEKGSAALAWESTVGSGRGARHLGIGIKALDTTTGSVALLVLEDRSALAAEARRRQHAERLAAVGELAAGAAHEINNPLASIKGFAQLLSRETLDRGQQQALDIISQECSRVARIVDNLLDFATQQRKLGTERFNLSRAVEKVIALKRYSLETSGIEVDADLDFNMSDCEAEKGAVQRLLLILVNHAERSLLRKDSDRTLSLRSRETNDGVVLYVSDNGPGIPRHHLPHLLHEGEPTDGLSLSSASGIADAHGGSLWVESGEGKGTTVTLRLPRAAGASPSLLTDVLREARPAEQAEEDQSTAVRVLVADDEPTLRLALSMYLTRHGFEVAQAATVDEALGIMAKRRFDVALVDVRMPGDGLKLIDRMDEDKQWSGRAILMTGDHTLDRVKHEIQSGRPHLTKPFDMGDAVRLVEKVSHRDEPENTA